MLYDLHVHTCLSDGEMNKIDILKKANDRNFDFISFTDHNIVDIENNLSQKYMEYYDSKSKTEIISGVEIDVEDKDVKYHILLYGIKDYIQLNNILCYNNDIKKEAIKELLSLLKKKYKIEIEYSDLKNGNSKREVITLLMEMGYGNNPNEVADKYTSKYSSTYVKLPCLSLQELNNKVIDIVKCASLAHPYSLKQSRFELDSTIKKLKNNGIESVELINLKWLFQSDYKELKTISDKYEMLYSCGSDYHKEKDELGLNNNISKKLIRRIM